MTEKKIKISFAPGCFDNFEGTQEELDEMIEEIKRKVEDGSLFEESIPLENMEEDELKELFEMLDEIDEKDRSRKLN